MTSRGRAGGCGVPGAFVDCRADGEDIVDPEEVLACEGLSRALRVAQGEGVAQVFEALFAVELGLLGGVAGALENIGYWEPGPLAGESWKILFPIDARNQCFQPSHSVLRPGSVSLFASSIARATLPHSCRRRMLASF